MSPQVQRPRTPDSRRPDPDRQHWGMLLFESLSAGVMAIFAGFVVVTIVVGIYVIIIWPLTFWDLANLGLEKYHSWINPILWSVFAAGSLAGYWCFGGAAFKTRQKASVPAPTKSRDRRIRRMRASPRHWTRSTGESGKTGRFSGWGAVSGVT